MRQLDRLWHLAFAATHNFDLPPDLNIKMINLSENATYKVEAPDGRRWALRLHRPGYHSKQAIISELAWMIDLRGKGVVVTPTPVAGKNGEFLQFVSHPAVSEPRYAVLSEWLAGSEPDISQDLQKPFEILGEVTAHMHGHAKRWQRPAQFERPTWNFETALTGAKPHWGRWQDGMGVDPEKQKLFGRTVAAIGKRLAAYGSGPERFGLIHCDLRLANLLLDGDKVNVIDFDDCGFSWFMYDAATPVSFYEHEPQVPDLIEAWKQGYRRIGALGKADEAEIPTFVMLRRLLLVAWIGSHAETDLAISMGLGYTEQTSALCDKYLISFS
jgi:Ser/Thr protein kinase RdoA (MazF antagonist)